MAALGKTPMLLQPALGSAGQHSAVGRASSLTPVGMVRLLLRPYGCSNDGNMQAMEKGNTATPISINNDNDGYKKNETKHTNMYACKILF